jgi:NMD protein affecting ribosome stability and mRNA decay
MENKIKCADCGKNDVPPYRKKYCDDCANRRKAEYEAGKGLPLQHSGEPNTAYTESEKIVDKPVDERSASIVAQVILKGAVELAKKCDGQELCELVNELTGAYKLALSNVKAL